MKYNFKEVHDNQIVMDFTPSARVSAYIWAKKNNVKIKTKVQDGKLLISKHEG